MLRRFHPWHDLMDLRNEVSRIFDSFMREPFSIKPFETTWSPSLDVYETDKELVIKAELPGMSAKDVDITLTENTLTLKGEKKKTEETKSENYYRMESAYGSFVRTIPIPIPVKRENIKASFKEGILEIKLPKDEKKEKGVHIKIEE